MAETWTTPRTWPATDYVVTAADLNEQVRDNLDYLKGKVDGEGARAQSSGTQSIPDGTWTAVAFAGADAYDTEAIHDPATNNSRLVCVTAGKYLIVGNVKFAAHASGVRSVRVRLNGSSILAEQTCDIEAESSTWQPGLNVTTLFHLAAGDYVELQVYQNSGGALNITTDGSMGALMMQRLGA